MHKLNFLIGSGAIATAMALRLSHPAPAPTYQEGAATDATPEPYKPSEKNAADQQASKTPQLVLPPLPPDRFAPGLSEFEHESESLLRQRLDFYLKKGDSTRALLAAERLVEKGYDDDAIREKWTSLMAEAPLWQPDPKDRRSVTFQLSVILPSSTKWNASEAKQAWQQKIVQLSGGLILPRISIRRDTANDPRLKLGKHESVAIQSSDGTLDVEQALAVALNRVGGLSERPVSSLNDALTRREWNRLERLVQRQ